MAPQRQPPVSGAGIGSLLSGFARPYFSRIEQYFCSRTGGARKRGIAAHERGRNGTFAEDLELRGEGVGVLDPQALEEAAEPEPALLLELDGDPRRDVPGIADLGDGVDVGAAAEAAVGEHALEPVEGAEDLLARRRVGGRDVLEARLQVGCDQRVLGRIVVVEGALADARLGGDGVNADSADPLRIEELVRGGEDAFYTGLCTQGLTEV